MNMAVARHPHPGATVEDVFFTVRDGLRLHARHYRAPRSDGRRAVLCLGSIAGSGLEFDELGSVLSQSEACRDVYTIDVRGRGMSDHDPEWRNYTPFFETLDVLDFLAYARLHDVAVIGSSRGGLLAMMIASVQPAAIGAVVLNDIGPQIETAGWVRLMGRIGRVPTPKSWDEAARFVRELERRDFPRLGDAAWTKIARQRYLERDGSPIASYDPLISRAFSLTTLSAGVPPMWPQFRALCRVPLLLVRGGRSDVLSQATAEAMQRMHPRMWCATIPDQGHVPLVGDPQVRATIQEFLAATD